VVFRGTATVQRGGVAIALIGPGEHIGEIALLDGRPRLATVRAEEDLRTGFLPSGDFLDVLDASPDVALEMLIAFASRFRALEEQLAQAQAQLAAKDADLP
jgi:CRP-like cAMP-binding protein